jgi:DNA-binding transcriptional regulator LsrR (DeoR family)
MDMDVDLELEMKISRRELRVLRLHEFHFARKARYAARLTTRCLAERLGCSHTTVERHLHKLDKTWKYRVWVTYELLPHQLQQTVDASMELMTPYRNYQ